MNLQALNTGISSVFTGGHLGSPPGILEQANLITKTVFPAEIVPVSVFLSCLASHLIALALLVASAAIFLNQISIFLVLLPVYLFAIGLLGVGVGWIVASLHVFLRDTAQVLSVVLTFWFFGTPIMLAESQYPSWARLLLAANPLTYFVRAYRDIFLSSRPPGMAISPSLPLSECRHSYWAACFSAT